jgi:Zn-finger nucleic acid-binding protein
MQCPACHHFLRPLKAGTVTLDVCHDCGGIWFDDSELKKVNVEYPRPEDVIARFGYSHDSRVEENANRPCPRCDGTKLEQKLYNLGSGVIMDCCPKCKGVWLDHGEFEKIRESIMRSQHRTRAIPVTVGQDVAISFNVLQKVQSLQLGSPPPPH